MSAGPAPSSSTTLRPQMIQQMEGGTAAAPVPNPLSDLSSPLTPPVTSDPPPSPYPRPSASPFISEDQFGCHCCYDVLVNPTTLNCGHSFCRHCLALWWESSRKTECPECREKWEGFPKVNILLRDAVERLFSEVVGRRRAEIQGNPKVSQSLLAFQRYGDQAARGIPKTSPGRGAGGFFSGVLTVLTCVAVMFLVYHWSSGDGVHDLLVSKPVSKWTPEEVLFWLEHVGAWTSLYKEPFLQENVNGRLLLMLGDEELTRAPYNIDNQAHRRAVLAELERIKELGVKPPQNLWEYKVHPSWRQWAEFLVKYLLLPYQLIAEFAWDWLSVHYWTSRFIIVNAMLLSVLEGCVLWRFYNRAEIRYRVCFSLSIPVTPTFSLSSFTLNYLPLFLSLSHTHPFLSPHLILHYPYLPPHLIPHYPSLPPHLILHYPSLSPLISFLTTPLSPPSSHPSLPLSHTHPFLPPHLIPHYPSLSPSFHPSHPLSSFFFSSLTTSLPLISSLTTPLSPPSSHPSLPLSPPFLIPHYPSLSSSSHPSLPLSLPPHLIPHYPSLSPLISSLTTPLSPPSSHPSLPLSLPPHLIPHYPSLSILISSLTTPLSPPSSHPSLPLSLPPHLIPHYPSLSPPHLIPHYPSLSPLISSLTTPLSPPSSHPSLPLSLPPYLIPHYPSFSPSSHPSLPLFLPLISSLTTPLSPPSSHPSLPLSLPPHLIPHYPSLSPLISSLTSSLSTISA
uniref:Bifunctional apoptosis regulator n=1 Tax=Salmo trutta TaxID=8032 RepID=A0A673ZX45_SALTR